VLLALLRYALTGSRAAIPRQHALDAIKKWREDCFYIFFGCAINQTTDRALLKGDTLFIEPQRSIGDAFSGKHQ
jgi:hypothetical protein